LAQTTFPGPIEVVSQQFSLPLESAEAAMSVNQFLIVGERFSESYAGVRVGPNGQVLDPQPFPIPGADTTPPQTTITSAPPVKVNSSSATFEFSSSEGGSTFECRLDGGAFSACTSPTTYTGLSEGNHTFEVTATDAAGNTDASSASWSWTVDVTAPETTISDGPPSTTNNTSASFSFSSSELGSSFQCQLDGAGFAACSSPNAYSGLADGGHVFEVKSTDPAGNQDSTPASRSWTVDTTGPGAPTLSSPLNGSSTSNTKPTFDWSDVVDPSGVSYQLQVDNSGGEFPSPEIDQSGLAPSSFTPSTSLPGGTYSWRARATDGAGNAGAWSSVFTVIITAPQGSIAGKVTNQATKAAIGGATVNCGSGGSATTASDGTYSITGVAPGSYTCTASASGYKPVSKTVTVKANRTSAANFALRKG
ncbi:MAG: carboxypeptidase regulatory-like domain-containing protein, partial [Acidimicrobiia bacterium]